MASGGGLVFSVRVDDLAVRRALRETRGEIRQDLKRILLEAATDTVLPTVKSTAIPTRMRRAWVARSSTSAAWITTTVRGKGRAIVGLLNFGGTVRAEIVPKKRRALKIGPDVFVARVSGPRTYAGRHFIEAAIEKNMRRYTEHVQRALIAVIEERIAAAQARVGSAAA